MLRLLWTIYTGPVVKSKKLYAKILLRQIYNSKPQTANPFKTINETKYLQDTKIARGM